MKTQLVERAILAHTLDHFKANLMADFTSHIIGRVSTNLQQDPQKLSVIEVGKPNNEPHNLEYRSGDARYGMLFEVWNKVTDGSGCEGWRNSVVDAMLNPTKSLDFISAVTGAIKPYERVPYSVEGILEKELKGKLVTDVSLSEWVRGSYSYPQASLVGLLQEKAQEPLNMKELRFITANITQTVRDCQIQTRLDLIVKVTGLPDQSADEEWDSDSLTFAVYGAWSMHDGEFMRLPSFKRALKADKKRLHRERTKHNFSELCGHRFEEFLNMYVPATEKQTE